MGAKRSLKASLRFNQPLFYPPAQRLSKDSHRARFLKHGGYGFLAAVTMSRKLESFSTSATV